MQCKLYYQKMIKNHELIDTVSLHLISNNKEACFFIINGLNFIENNTTSIGLDLAALVLFPKDLPSQYH